MSATTPVKRPIGVTILAGLAGIAALLAAYHLLQSLGIIKITVGPISVRGFNLWNAFMWGIMLWIWVWVVQMLWSMNPQGWLFLAVISIFNLIVDFTYLIGQSTTWSDISVSFIVNAVILIYLMLPNIRRAFGQK